MTDLARLIIHAPQFLITWSVFFGFGLITYVIYSLRNKKYFGFRELYEHCVPFNILTEASFHADVKIYLIGKFTDGFVFIPAIMLNAWLCLSLKELLSGFAPDYRAMEFTVTAASICTVVVFVVVEFSDFLFHYAEHKVPMLWELHKVHHSAQSLNPLTSKRGHPVSLALGGLTRASLTAIPGGLFVFLYDITVVEAAALSVVASKIFVIATLDPLKHSHHPISLGWFDRLLISPHMHQIHHSKSQPHWDKNFGTNLSIFDWMSGTAYKPDRGEKAVYGISGHSDEALSKYNTLYGAYMRPLLKSLKKGRKALGNAEVPVRRYGLDG